MKNSNNPIRIKAIQDYNDSPNFCKQCSKKIEIKDNDRITDIRKKKFCSRTCSAINSNLGRCRYKGLRSTICSCGNKKTKKGKVCKDCYKKENGVQDKPISYFLKDGKYSTTKLTHLRKCAKYTLEKSDKKKECIFCKDETLEPILQVCHLKGIMEFDKEISMSIVNHIDNLEWMCPNHHALYDRKLIVHGAA